MRLRLDRPERQHRRHRDLMSCHDCPNAPQLQRASWWSGLWVLLTALVISAAAVQIITGEQLF